VQVNIPVKPISGEKDYVSVRWGKDGEWVRVKGKDFYPKYICKVVG